MPDPTDRADLIGFTLTHALLRNELPRLAAAFAGSAMTPEQEGVVEEQLRLVTDHLLRHHQEATPCIACPGCRPAARPAGGRAHPDGPTRGTGA
jgi:hypothetical protein